MARMHILQVGSNMIACRDCEASDGVSIRTLMESCIRVKRFPQADVGVTRKKALFCGALDEMLVRFFKFCAARELQTAIFRL